MGWVVRPNNERAVPCRTRPHRRRHDERRCDAPLTRPTPLTHLFIVWYQLFLVHFHSFPSQPHHQPLRTRMDPTTIPRRSHGAVSAARRHCLPDYWSISTESSHTRLDDPTGSWKIPSVRILRGSSRIFKNPREAPSVDRLNQLWWRPRWTPSRILEDPHVRWSLRILEHVETSGRGPSGSATWRQTASIEGKWRLNGTPFPTTDFNGHIKWYVTSHFIDCGVKYRLFIGNLTLNVA